MVSFYRYVNKSHTNKYHICVNKQTLSKNKFSYILIQIVFTNKYTFHSDNMRIYIYIYIYGEAEVFRQSVLLTFQ